MWPFSTSKKELGKKVPEEDTYCAQLAIHVGEAYRSKILMDEAHEKMHCTRKTIPYDCKEYAYFMEEFKKAYNEYVVYSHIWLEHINILSTLILPLVSVIVDVGGIKYKVAHKYKYRSSDFYIDIEKMV